jgi:hypothetical protein
MYWLSSSDGVGVPPVKVEFDTGLEGAVFFLLLLFMLLDPPVFCKKQKDLFRFRNKVKKRKTNLF